VDSHILSGTGGGGNRRSGGWRRAVWCGGAAGGGGTCKEGGAKCNPYAQSTGSGESRGSPLSDVGSGGPRLHCVAHSTINNVAGGVTGSGMGADGLSGCWSGSYFIAEIVAWGCKASADMAAGGRHTATQHGLCVISIVSIIWHNVLERRH
jgi:hypothetical protein